MYRVKIKKYSQKNLSGIRTFDCFIEPTNSIMNLILFEFLIERKLDLMLKIEKNNATEREHLKCIFIKYQI